MALFSVRQSTWFRLERLDGDCRVAEIFKAQQIEIVAAKIDVEVLAPIVLDALVDNVVPGRELLDPVGTAAERRLERRLGDAALFAVLVGSFPPVLRHDGELADDLRQFAIAGAFEGEGNLAVAGLFRLGDGAETGGRHRT